MSLHAQRVDARLNLIAVLIVASAMILGGGGSPSPLPETLLQILALLALCAWAFLAPKPLPQAAPQAWAIAGLLLVLPLVQLIPLPPALWHTLPGREAERAALALVGADEAWRPWSVAPARSLAAFLAVVAPVIVLLITASVGRAGRSMILAGIAGVALLSVMVGTAQMAGGDQNTWRLYVPDMAYLSGFQANHNSSADVLLIGMVAFAAAVREWRTGKAPAASPHTRLAVVVGGIILFSLAVFLTASRAGVFLLPVAWAAVALIVRPWLVFSQRTWKWVAAGCLAAIAVALLAALSSGVVARIWGRFDFTGEVRPQLWRDSLFAALQYFPWGAGMGAFVPVFIAAERLEVVDPSIPNRAHNELLELFVEGGVAGMAILFAIAVILVRRLLAGRRELPAGSVAQVYFAGSVLALIALHSQVDYPLRSMSLACIAAVAAGLLMPAPRDGRAQVPVA